MLTVGDREVRVSSPERVVYEATEWAPEVTKLQVCEYFNPDFRDRLLEVETPIHLAIENRWSGVVLQALTKGKQK